MGWIRRTKDMCSIPVGIANLNANITSDVNEAGVGPDGEYREPWGTPYVISMDTSLNDRCRDQHYSRRNVSQDSGQKGVFGLFNATTGGAADEFEFNGKFLIWSLGADKKVDTLTNPNPPPYGGARKGFNKDNLIGWQE